MIHLATILIATDDPALGQDILGKARQHGYDGRVVTSQAAALATAQQENPDIVVAGSSLEGGDVFSLTAALRALDASNDTPVCLITAERGPALKRRAFEAGIDDVLSLPLDDIALLARLRPLVRLSTMQAELRLRARTAQHFAVTAASRVAVPPDGEGYRVLFVGDDDADLRAVLPGAKIDHATLPYEAEDLLGAANFDVAVVAPPVGDPIGYLELCAQMRNNPRLFNLPVLLLGHPGQVDDTVAYQHGASVVFQRPADPVEFQVAVLSLVRRQRQRWAIRAAVQETLQAATRDASTGVYSRPFLDRYLTEQLDFAKTHGRHLSIAFFRVPDLDNVRQRFGPEQATHLRLQLSQWITGLLRGEDLTALYEENEFCIVLPDTPRAEADVVMHRIAGVLTYTDFAVVDVYQPVKVWVRVGAADLQPDDDLASLVTRAHHSII